MNRSIIKRLSIYGIVMLFSFFAFGCGTKEAAQQGSDIQQEESQVEVKETEMFDLENGTVKLNSGYEMPVIGLGTWTLSDEEAENYEIFDFELSEEEMREIEAINEQRRYENW